MCTLSFSHLPEKIFNLIMLIIKYFLHIKHIIGITLFNVHVKDFCYDFIRFHFSKCLMFFFSFFWRKQFCENLSQVFHL